MVMAVMAIRAKIFIILNVFKSMEMCCLWMISIMEIGMEMCSWQKHLRLTHSAHHDN